MPIMFSADALNEKSLINFEFFIVYFACEANYLKTYESSTYEVFKSNAPLGSVFNGRDNFR